MPGLPIDFGFTIGTHIVGAIAKLCWKYILNLKKTPQNTFHKRKNKLRFKREENKNFKGT
jgi:hypothetical protein